LLSMVLITFECHLETATGKKLSTSKTLNQQRQTCNNSHTLESNPQEKHMPRVTLTERQQKSLYRDGFLVIRNAVPQAMVQAARRKLNMSMGQLRNRAAGAKKLASVQSAVTDTFRVGADPAILDLFNKTDARRTIEAFFGGPVETAKGAQVATTFPTEPTDQVNESGFKDSETPFHGWCGHLDGLWNGAAPVPGIGESFTAAKQRKWYQDPSRNGCFREYPALNSNLRNFGALVGIALSDQRLEGAGNLGLLKGAHHKMGQFFQQQRAAGGPLGPDGPDWPREHTEAPNGHGLRHYPEAVRNAYRRNAEVTADGTYWPMPTLVKVSPGDAVIVHFATPHSATRVVGPDPRFMVYFRTSPKRRPEQFRSVYPDALCDIWLEWRGMRKYIKAQSESATSQGKS
jgi:hypothetical protein